MTKSTQNEQPRTAHDAALQLPECCREQFLRLWKEANTEDLYDGNLAQYMSAIAVQFRDTKKLLEVAKDVMMNIKGEISKLRYTM